MCPELRIWNGAVYSHVPDYICPEEFRQLCKSIDCPKNLEKCLVSVF